MKLEKLEETVKNHTGIFNCVQIHDEKNTKTVSFQHDHASPIFSEEIPVFGKLRDFYETFGSLLLYSCTKSDEAAAYIGAPDEWESLRAGFNDWTDGLCEEERRDYLPEWVNTCIVVGEIPRTGNYLLMATNGAETGHIFEFEHDGFEFIEHAQDIEEYVYKMLKPDGSTLVGIASHMRFIEGDSRSQWWIKELVTNDGYVVSTEK